MAKRIIVPLMNGFEETEYIATRDVLIREGIDVESVSLTGEKLVRANHNLTIAADYVWGDQTILINEYDGIFIPGGAIGVENLDKSLEFDNILNEMSSNNKVVAAICAAPTLLAKRGLLKERNAVVFPDPKFIKVLLDNEVIYQEDEITAVDENYVTGKDFKASFELGYVLAKHINDWKA